MSRTSVLTGLLIVIVAAGILLAAGTALGSPAHVLNFQLTDPPLVPQGTQSLIVGYSSVRAHLTGQDAGWVSGTGSGSVNLMNLVNSSMIIGKATLPANASINQVSFVVTYASITINGSTYNVTVPNDLITANVTAQSINNGSVLIDLSPSIVTIVTGNSSDFILVPSVRAVFVGSSRLVGIGQLRHFQEESNISVSSAQLNSFGSNVSLTVTVHNNGNQSVELRQVFLYGNFTILLQPWMNVSSNGNYQGGGGGGIIVPDQGIGVEVHSQGEVNLPGIRSMINIGTFFRSIKVLAFEVQGNGSLTLLNAQNAFGSQGLMISPGGSATLTFSGPTTFGDGRITVSPVVGQSYKAFAIGSEDAHGQASVIDG